MQPLGSRKTPYNQDITPLSPIGGNKLEQIKKTADYTIYQKRSKRYAVRDAKRAWISGDEKIKILLSEKLITVAAPKPKAEPEAEAEAAAE
jgi:hypothetical protein